MVSGSFSCPLLRRFSKVRILSQAFLDLFFVDVFGESFHVEALGGGLRKRILTELTQKPIGIHILRNSSFLLVLEIHHFVLVFDGYGVFHLVGEGPLLTNLSRFVQSGHTSLSLKYLYISRLLPTQIALPCKILQLV